MLLEKDVKPRKRAIIYCRVSSEKQKQDGESLEFQEEKCRQWAELHDVQVIVVLLEAKSGYIHYSYREKLTLARQMIRDGLADMIIVWDLSRFSRNFVHSAMIFQEIESHGGEVVSVNDNIDNSRTGQLVRSILAWCAESEREKILELPIIQVESDIDLDAYDDEWFTIHKLRTMKLASYPAIQRAIESGALPAHTRQVDRTVIHRDELNRFLRESPIKSRSLLEDITERIDISYSPLFVGTGVQTSKDAQQVVNVVHNAGLAKLVARLKPVIVVKG
jgi:predicted site-specific integrase-resolvase